jgi:hypothetical protein
MARGTMNAPAEWRYLLIRRPAAHPDDQRARQDRIWKPAESGKRHGGEGGDFLRLDRLTAHHTPDVDRLDRIWDHELGDLEHPRLARRWLGGEDRKARCALPRQHYVRMCNPQHMRDVRLHGGIGDKAAGEVIEVGQDLGSVQSFSAAAASTFLSISSVIGISSMLK